MRYNNEKDLEMHEKMVFPNDLPQSEQIIKFSKNECSLVAVFWYLFKKYIQESHAILEINISSKARFDISQILTNTYPLTDFDGDSTATQNITIDLEEKNKVYIDLLPLFETCRVEVTYLLQSSYARFKRTPQFGKVLGEVLDSMQE